jgi:hypothetical protein
MSDEFAEYDGAYVLGALSAEERDAFEAHLIECADCRARVAELADLPDLLALVPESAYQSAPARPDPVVALLETVRARRARRRWITAAAATAAAAVVIAATALLTSSASTPAKPATVAAAPQVTMTELTTAPIHATVAVKDVAWGTSIKLTCTYAEEASYPTDLDYSLVVRTKDGRTENLGSWALVPDQVTTFPAGTALHKSDIASISVDTANGTPLLKVDY